MTTLAINPAAILAPVRTSGQADPRPDLRVPTSVANPRRTTWTGPAKDETDRLPAR